MINRFLFWYKHDSRFLIYKIKERIKIELRSYYRRLTYRCQWCGREILGECYILKDDKTMVCRHCLPKAHKGIREKGNMYIIK